mmetsp:Transcript_3274/g.4935  ORF Transcript_3274/g.4935 Transcript_3274/m.4935 type:complete len:298 (+) Transcript_3274:58-951(+)
MELNSDGEYTYMFVGQSDTDSSEFMETNSETHSTTKRSCTSNKLWQSTIKPNNIKICLFVLYVAFWIPLYIFSYPDITNNYVYSLQPSITRTFTVVLFGDSLINIPCLYFGLQEKLQHQFPNFNLNIINAGINGGNIAMMNARVYTDVIDLNPDAVFIYWDTDISDQPVDVLSEESTQIDYVNSLTQVVTAIKKNSTYFAVAGPGILGEGPIFPSDDFYVKRDMLDFYRSLNKNTTESLGVPYIDMRGALQNAIPKTWFWSRWYVSADGEHPNERGTRIIAQQFGIYMNIWLSGYQQ